MGEQIDMQNQAKVVTNSILNKKIVHDLDRKRKDLDVYEPVVDLLTNEEVDALEAREERHAR